MLVKVMVDRVEETARSPRGGGGGSDVGRQRGDS